MVQIYKENHMLQQKKKLREQKWLSLIERSISDYKKPNGLRKKSYKIKASVNFYLMVLIINYFHISKKILIRRKLSAVTSYLDLILKSKYKLLPLYLGH